MNVKTIYHQYKDNLLDFQLPNDNEFIRKCARRYLIGQIKNRKSIERYRKTAKGKATSILASRKYYNKKKDEKNALTEAKIIIAKKTN